MKGWLFGLLVLSVSVVNCRKEADNPIESVDLLYRTWRLVQFTREGGTPTTVSAHSSNILTFRQNGTILYGADGRYAVCCSPTLFNRKGNVLDLVDVASIPIPSDVPRADCAAVDCIPLDSAWQIIILDSSKLVIKNDRGTAIYYAYP